MNESVGRHARVGTSLINFVSLWQLFKSKTTAKNENNLKTPLAAVYFMNVGLFIPKN